MRGQGFKAVVVSLEESHDLDSTALDALIEFDAEMRKDGVQLRLARAHDQVRDLLDASGARDLAARCDYSVDDAVRAALASAPTAQGSAQGPEGSR